MKDIETFITQDGSIGLYNKKLGEIYHSKYGAKKEALEKFVLPAKILDNRPLDILDICYGIGYNTKCALENYQNIRSIDCIETDKELVLKSPEFDYSPKINEIISKNIKEPDFIRFFVEDARCCVNMLNKTYDIIFHDGFAPHKQSELWSEEFIYAISKLLKKEGIYATYNHSKPVLNALLKAGLMLGRVVLGDKTIATVASFCPELIQNPLSEFELGQLKTKSAICYKDKNLNLTHEEIIKNREAEIKSSNLISLSHYLKVYGMI